MGVSSIAEGSVIVKQSVRTATYPSTILTTTPQKIDLGSVSEASLISSDICTAQSKPSMDPRGVNKPIIVARPTVGQLPPLKKSSKATRALFFEGAITSRGMMMAKRPKMWITRMIISIIGSCLAIAVLKMMANVTTAMTRRVPCQAWGL